MGIGPKAATASAGSCGKRPSRHSLTWSCFMAVKSAPASISRRSRRRTALLATAFAHLGLGETLSAAKLLGVASGPASVGLIALSAGGRTSVPGIVLAISAALGWALGTVYGKAYPKLWFVGLQFLMGDSAFTVVSLLVPTPTVHWTLLAALDLLFIILGGTAGAWVLRLLWLSRAQVSRVSTVVFGIPAVTSLVDILALGEPLSVRFVVAFAAVAAGIGLASARFVRSQTNPP